MSAAGSSADNAAAESFNASFKRETLQGRTGWSTEHEASLTAFRWLHRHNTRRRHSRLGQRNPIASARAEAYAEHAEGYEDYESWPLLCAQLDVAPDSTVSPAYRVPHVLVEVAADMYTRPMNPDQLAEFIEAVAGQLEELRAMHPRLAAARAEWDARANTITSAETT
jgi:hypothetical protein